MASRLAMAPGFREFLKVFLGALINFDDLSIYQMIYLFAEMFVNFVCDSMVGSAHVCALRICLARTGPPFRMASRASAGDFLPEAGHTAGGKPLGATCSQSY